MSYAPTPALQVEPRRARTALAFLLIGISMSLIDATIVNVALPTIRDSLNASEATLSWILSGYSLAFGLMLIPAGRLGDRYGHKWVFVTGLALFTLASVACGLAQTDGQLIVARIAQGLAGGIFLPAVAAYIQLMFAGRSRGKAFGVLGAVLGVSSAIGPVLGGLIIAVFGEENGWRLVFGVNLPIGIVALAGAIVFVPNSAKNPAGVGGGDFVGLLLLAAGLACVLVPLIEGHDQGWPVWTFVCLGAGVLLIVAFAFWEVAVDRRGRTPLVPPRLYSHLAFTWGTILALVYFAAFVSIFFSLSLLWQVGLGYSALLSGLVTIPFAIGSIAGATRSSELAASIGRRVLVIGTALVTVGLGATWLVLRLVPTADLTGWAVLLPLAVAGFGSGLFIAPNSQFIVATVDPADAGAASGVVSTMQRIGAAIGIAVIGSVFFGVQDLPTDRRPTASEVATAFHTGATAALGVSVLFSIVAFLLVFTLPKTVGRPGGQRPPAADAPSEPAAVQPS